MVFPVVTWELNHKEGWVPKNWCFSTVVLEKTLKNPLDSKEIKLVNPKGKWKPFSSVWLCHPMNYTVHGIFQARILEWVAFPFSRGSSQPRSPTLQVDSLPAKLKGSPRKLEWVTYPFSRGSSWPKNWTRVSCIAGGFFTNRAIREVQLTTPPQIQQFLNLEKYVL